jgi:cyclopropane-fatty-acyl-phospholipid synthase
LAEERIRAAGLERKITVLLCDYRQHNAVRKYDKVIALEMVEHVGAEYLDTFFSKVNEYLKNEGGIAVFQLSTVPETRYEGYRKGVDFIQKWVRLTLVWLRISDIPRWSLSNCFSTRRCHKFRI